MPGSSGGDSVVAATATALFPYALSRAFQQQRFWALEQNVYVDGTLQSTPKVGSSRRAWRMVLPMTAAEFDALQDFWVDEALRGLKPFYFYDLYETDPKFTYDATMAAPDGLYIVRFDGPWSHALQLGELKCDSSLSLLQVS